MSRELDPRKEMDEWGDKIPMIPVPRGYKVAPIPPFGGAVVRLWIEKPNGDKVSIYLDCYNNLGYYHGPYWEVYPVDGDVGRCPIDDVETLVDLIKRSK